MERALVLDFVDLFVVVVVVDLFLNPDSIT